MLEADKKNKFLYGAARNLIGLVLIAKWKGETVQYTPKIFRVSFPNRIVVENGYRILRFKLHFITGQSRMHTFQIKEDGVHA